MRKIVLNHLIGTFCIVNNFTDNEKNSFKPFNRNILYCKFKLKILSFFIYKNLIGTFCIVNKIDINITESAFNDLIGTFCIVNCCN